MANSPTVQSASSVSFKQTLRQIVTNSINTNFLATLGKEADIVNIVMSLMYLESSMRPTAIGKSIPIAVSSSARDYWNSSAVSCLRPTATQQQLANLQEGLQAWGLMQCMGWNLVRGASIAGGGKQVIESARPDLAAALCVNPGESIRAKYYGEPNIGNQIMVGLIILESKYKAVKGSGNTFTIGKLTFSSKISAAVAAYLGLGPKDVVTGITPQQYSNSICYGSAYKAANSAAAPSGSGSQSNPSAQQTASGPVTTPASGQNQVPPGC
jgi:hypothetical protein